MKLSTYNKDLENSTICLWKTQIQHHDNVFRKSTIIYTLYVFIVQFKENSTVFCVSSNSTNSIVNIPHYILDFLQNQNTEEKVLKTIEMPKDSEPDESEKNEEPLKNIDE